MRLMKIKVVCEQDMHLKTFLFYVASLLIYLSKKTRLNVVWGRDVKKHVQMTIILIKCYLVKMRLPWPHVGQVLTVRRIRINKATGEILSDQSHLLLTSLNPEKASASDLLDLCRGHWTIENRFHYVRDVTFGEDASQVRNDSLPQIMAAFRNTVICALRRLGAINKGSLSENSANPFTVFTYLAM